MNKINIPDEIARRKVAQLLGVDEVKIDNVGDVWRASVRIGNMWVSSTADIMTIIEDTKDPSSTFSRLFFDLADNLRQRLSIETARGEVLDGLAAIQGVQRVPTSRPPIMKTETQKQPANRFEAVVAELKKMDPTS